MKNAEKIVGVLFVGLTVMNLLRGDWLGSALTGLAAAAVLLRERLRLPLWADVVLAVVVLILLLLKLSQAFGWAFA